MMTDGDNDDDADDTYSSVKQALKRIQGGSKKSKLSTQYNSLLF